METTEKTINETPEKKPVSKWPLWVRLLSLFLVFIMVAEMVLMGASRVKFSSSNYEDSDYEKAAEYLEENDEYLTASNLKRMRDLIKLVGKPKTYEEYSLFASVAIADEDYTKAEAYLQGAVERYEGEPKAHADLIVKLGCICAMNDEWTKAGGHFREALRLDSSNEDAWLMLAESYLRENDYENALETMTKYSEMVELNTDQLTAMASMQLVTQRYTECLESCNAALKDPDADKADLYLVRCQAYMMLNKTDECLADADACLENGGDEADILPIKANILEIQEQYPQAYEAYSKLAESPDADYELLQHTVQCAYMCDRYEEMLTYAQRLDSLNLTKEQRIETKKWLGVAQLQTEDYAGALVSLNEYMDNVEDVTELYYLRGVCYLATEQYEPAVQDYTASIKADYLVDECLYNRALCYMSLNKPTEAAADFQLIVDRDESPEIVALTKELLNLK